MTRKIFVTALSFGFGAMTTAAVIATTRPINSQVIALKSKADDVREARHHLTQARDLLSKADHDEKGDDYKAFKLCEQAIDSCDKYLGVRGDKGDQHKGD
jgi:hypothetical protein